MKDIVRIRYVIRTRYILRKTRTIVCNFSKRDSYRWFRRYISYLDRGYCSKLIKIRDEKISK